MALCFMFKKFRFVDWSIIYHCVGKVEIILNQKKIKVKALKVILQYICVGNNSYLCSGQVVGLSSVQLPVIWCFIAFANLL